MIKTPILTAAFDELRALQGEVKTLEYERDRLQAFVLAVYEDAEAMDVHAEAAKVLGLEP